MYEKIKKWYEQRLWSAEMVAKAVEKGVITQLQGQMILEGTEEKVTYG